MAKRKILIDCDPGHDDAVALLFAARHLDLVGVTTVHGNNSLENTTRNALAVLELGGIEVPWHAVAPNRWPCRTLAQLRCTARPASTASRYPSRAATDRHARSRPHH